MICQTCKNELNLDEVKFKNKKRKITCKVCKKTFNLYWQPKGLVKLSSGQMIRIKPKVKMSKKERRKVKNEE